VKCLLLSPRVLLIHLFSDIGIIQSMNIRKLVENSHDFLFGHTFSIWSVFGQRGKYIRHHHYSCSDAEFGCCRMEGISGTVQSFIWEARDFPHFRHNICRPLSMLNQ